MSETKTHWKKITNPDYLGAYSIMDGSESGKDLVVTIKEVVRETVTGPDGKKEECTVCKLVNQKPLILNATNQKTMTKLFNSPYIEDWSGKQMTLYVAKVKAFGETIDALRVRATPPKAAELPELTPSHAKWNDAKIALKNGNTTINKIKEKYFLSAENEAKLKEA